MSENGKYSKPKEENDVVRKLSFKELLKEFFGLRQKQDKISEQLAEEKRKGEATSQLLSESLEIYRQAGKVSGTIRKLSEEEKNNMLNGLSFESMPQTKTEKATEEKQVAAPPPKEKQSFMVKMQNVTKAFGEEMEVQGKVYEEYKMRSEPGYFDRVRKEKSDKKRASIQKRLDRTAEKRIEEAKKTAKKADAAKRKRSEEAIELAAKGVSSEITPEPSEEKTKPVSKGESGKKNKSTAKKNPPKPKNPKPAEVTPEERGFFEAFEEENARTQATQKIEAKTMQVVVQEKEPEDFEKLVAKIAQRLREETFSSPDGLY